MIVESAPTHTHLRVNLFLVIHLLEKPPIPSELCRAWLIFQHSTAMIIQTLLEGILLLRGRRDLTDLKARSLNSVQSMRCISIQWQCA